MRKVVHASLDGNGFTLEEAGYEALRAYLGRAAAQLGADPDLDEILGDLEQAIADKCARHLSAHKSVVTADEMRQVLAEMGPVGTPGEVGPDGAGPATAGSPSAEAGPRAPPAGEPVRRLYRVLEGGKLAGLCNGLGAYLGVDANIVRVIFVVLALLTHGAWALVYLVLVFVVPVAGTPEERAAARGLPFSAQALIDEAKRHYASLEKELQGPWAHWRARWRSGAREARHQARRAADQARRAWRTQQASWTASPVGAPGAPSPPPAPPAPPAPSPYSRQVVTGLMVPVVAFWSAALVVGEVVCASLLIVDGQILGWSPGLPLWGSLLVLALLAAVIGRPLGFARSALHRPAHPGAVPWLAAWGAVFWLGFAALLGWLAWTLSPELRAVAHDLPGAWEQVRDSWHASH